jgi:hypothetical protein
MSTHDQDAEHRQMRALFDRALETGPAKAAIHRLTYCVILDRLTNGDQQLAASMFADPEPPRRENSKHSTTTI